MHIVLKTIIILLVGAMLVYCVNVFIYAPQIQDALYGAKEINLALIDSYFTTDASYLVQSIGMQLVVSYIAIVSGLTYATYFLQRGLPAKKALRKKKA